MCNSTHYDDYIQDAIELVSAWEFESEEAYFSALRNQAQLMAGLDYDHFNPPEAQLALNLQ